MRPSRRAESYATVALTSSRCVSLCVMGFQAPVQVIKVSEATGLGANSDATRAFAPTTRFALILNTTAEPSARTTSTRSPTRTRAS